MISTADPQQYQGAREEEGKNGGFGLLQHWRIHPDAEEDQRDEKLSNSYMGR